MAALLRGEPVSPAPISFEEIQGATRDGRLIREPAGERFYEYHPVTEHVVIAPQRCGGRLTIKRTRLDAGYVLGALERGESAEEAARDYEIPLAAVKEVQDLAHRNPRGIFERSVDVTTINR